MIKIVNESITQEVQVKSDFQNPKPLLSKFWFCLV